jgi:hypothetical protein
MDGDRRREVDEGKEGVAEKRSIEEQRSMGRRMAQPGSSAPRCAGRERRGTKSVQKLRIYASPMKIRKLRSVVMTTMGLGNISEIFCFVKSRF